MADFGEDLRRKEKAEEARWQFLQEKAFEIAAKRDKLFGLWAAARLMLVGEEASAYARAVVETGIGLGDRAMLDKVGGDLAAAGAAPDGEGLTAELDKCEAAARALVTQGSAP